MMTDSVWIATVELRFVLRDGRSILQQRWLDRGPYLDALWARHDHGGKAVTPRHEWRDVPLVIE